MRKRTAAILIFCGIMGLLLFGICLNKQPEIRESLGKALYARPNKEKEQSEEEDTEVKENKKIAITFDDGPHPIYTPLLLEGLRERDVKATFFLMGSAVEQYPELVKEMAEDGHLIGNHTYHHVSLARADETLIEKEVITVNELIEETIGQSPQFIRPPFGECSRSLEQQTGMICVLWNIDSLDWCTKDAAKVVRSVVTNARENGIILMHDQYQTSVRAALTIIDELQKQGYEFVTVEELLLD